MMAPRTLRLSLLALLLFVAPACSKKSDEGTPVASGPTVVDSELAKKIPSSSIGFVVWDTNSDAYRRYKASPWGQGGSSNLLKALEQADASGKGQELKPFIDVLMKTGLLTTQPGQAEVLKSAVGFIDLSNAPAVAVYASANPGNNLKDKLTEIETVFKNEGYSVTKRSAAPDGFSLQLKNQNPGAPNIGAIAFAANEGLLAISTQENLIQRLFTATTDSGVASIVASPEYQKTLGTLASPNQISLGYLDVKAGLSKLMATLPPEGMHEMQAQLNTIPLESVGISSQMGQGLASTVVAHIVPRDEEQKSWLGLLSASTNHETINQLPADTVFALSIEGTTLAKIRDKALQQMDPAAAAQMKQQLTALDSISNLTIAVRGANQMSPFPEVFLVASGSSPSTVQAAMKGTVNDLLKSFGLQLGDWQSREVEGTQMEFLVSPLGVGAFEAQAGNSVVLASSEGAVVDAVKASKDASKSLRSSAPASLKDLLSKGSLVFVYSNFERMTSLVKSVQGNLAMFTGGQSAVSDDTMEQLRKIGVFSASVAMNGDLLRIESRYDTPVGVEAK